MRVMLWRFPSSSGVPGPVPGGTPGRPKATNPRIAAADGIVLGSPVYTYNIMAHMKAFLDRLYCWYSFSEDRRFWTSRLAPGKRAAAVAVGEQEKPEYLGFALEAMALPLKDLGFSLKGTLLAAGFFRAGSVRKDRQVMQRAFTLGCELARPE